MRRECISLCGSELCSIRSAFAGPHRLRLAVR